MAIFSYPVWELLWFSSSALSIAATVYDTAVSFQILSHSLFNNHPTIRRWFRRKRNHRKDKNLEAEGSYEKRSYQTRAATGCAWSYCDLHSTNCNLIRHKFVLTTTWKMTKYYTKNSPLPFFYCIICVYMWDVFVYIVTTNTKFE